MQTDLDYFRSRLRINRAQLDEELAIHADHSDRISQGVKLATMADARARQSFEVLEAGLVRDLYSDDPKMTQARAAGEVKLRRDWKQAWETYQAVKAILLDWEGLQKAWYQKGFDLKALGDLYAHQYWHPDTIKAEPTREQRREQRSPVADYLEKRSGRRVQLDDDEQPPRRRSRSDA